SSKIDGEPVIVIPPKKVELVELDFTTAEREFYTSLEKRTLLRFNKYLREGLGKILDVDPIIPAIWAPPTESVESSSGEQADPVDMLSQAAVARLLEDSDIRSSECPICVDMGVLGVDSLVPLDKFCTKYGINADDEADDEKALADTDDVSADGAGPLVTTKRVDDPGWVSSTKIDRTVAILEQVRSDHPGDKTIVFSQFRGVLDLLEMPLTRRGLRWVRYDGSMSAEERDAAVRRLREDPDVNVILVSLKCGSLGLNLTCANHVVIFDFWWNGAV
ncbi:hypothetical protein HK405_000586, partial [Cladochytrium tenue]